MASDIDLEDLIDRGLSQDEILERYEDEGYDRDDYNEDLVDLEYEWDEALWDTIEAQDIDRDYLDDYAHDWADMLDVDVSDIYDAYYGYREDE